MKRIAITMGDPGGIGGEIILKAWSRLGRRTIPVVIGESSVFEKLTSGVLAGGSYPFRAFGAGRAGGMEMIDLGLVKEPSFGTTGAEYGRASYLYIAEALKLLDAGKVSGLVTCGISKKSIHMAGIDFPGHTELLANHAGTREYVMMMAARDLRVSLVTIHIPLRDVSSRATPSEAAKCIRVTHAALKDRFGIGAPRIKVCGLNPHAGEQGTIGSEDLSLAKMIEEIRKTGIDVQGPFPADSLFHVIDCDAYVAMYHDQGLVAVKTRDFKRTVNITLGLPFVRTSVGHGTGFDIAGTGRANPTSLIEAYRTAERMIRHKP